MTLMFLIWPGYSDEYMCYLSGGEQYCVGFTASYKHIILYMEAIGHTPLKPVHMFTQLMHISTSWYLSTVTTGWFIALIACHAVA